MLKSKLIAAGILSISALAFSLPAMASSYFSNKNYSGRYACHEDDGAGSQTVVNLPGGITSTYVVQPGGNGYYSAGELVLNVSALFGANPCVFTLYTSESSYWVDASGVVYETLVWADDTYGADKDFCSGAKFYHSVEGSLTVPTPYAPASSTLTTANTNLAWLIGIDLTGTGACTLGAP